MAKRTTERDAHPADASAGLEFPVESEVVESTQTLMGGAPFCDFRWRRRGGTS